MSEHYVVEPGTPKWMATVLSSIGGVLASGLLLWIASSQLNISTTQAVILRDLAAQEELLKINVREQDKDLKQLNSRMDQIWPRLRAHGENITLIKDKLEVLCKCKIQLRQPEQF